MRVVIFLILGVMPVISFAQQMKTVCSITVNSPDEKEMFRRWLPSTKYKFVELVERGKQEWLAAACNAGVTCDMLIVSGHFAGSEFYSENPGARENLAVKEMERISCSNKCPNLFAHLKEVYLFGCHTLDHESAVSLSQDMIRDLIRAGHSPAQAAHMAQELVSQYNESSLERMRRIFIKVPAIYGFGSAAPLGPAASVLLNQYFRTALLGEIGSGTQSHLLTSFFKNHAMRVTRGYSDGDRGLQFRNEICQFYDDRLPPLKKLEHIKQILQRPLAEVQLLIPKIEGFFADLKEADTQTEDFKRQMQVIQKNENARQRFLTFARDADFPPFRQRMLLLAQQLNWLNEKELQAEQVSLINRLLLSSKLSEADVDLVCQINREQTLNSAIAQIKISSKPTSHILNGILACLGDTEARKALLSAATNNQEASHIAQVLLKHLPLTPDQELFSFVELTANSNLETQIRNLEILTSQQVADSKALARLLKLFSMSKSLVVQKSIAQIFVKADPRQINRAEVTQIFRTHRQRSSDGRDIIDFAIERLER